MRTIGGVIIGLALIGPGITFLKWVAVSSGAYGSVSLADGCLALIVILLCVNLVRGTSPLGSRSPVRARRTPTKPGVAPTEPRASLTSENPEKRRRQPTGRRRPPTPPTRRER